MVLEVYLDPEPSKSEGSRYAIPKQAAFGYYFELIGSKCREMFSLNSRYLIQLQDRFFKRNLEPPPAPTRVPPTREGWPFPWKTRPEVNTTLNQTLSPQILLRTHLSFLKLI